jgi:hypothetical protein
LTRSPPRRVIIVVSSFVVVLLAVASLMTGRSASHHAASARADAKRVPIARDKIPETAGLDSLDPKSSIMLTQ